MKNLILPHLRPALTLLAVFSLLTGLAYPAAVTGLCQALFPAQANGSLVMENGIAVGSALIGQPFASPGSFWGRPSATAPGPDNAMASSGSNLGPSNPALYAAVAERAARLRAADPGNAAPVPAELVEASASGLDPHLSPAAVMYQVPRVARARGITPERVRELVRAGIEPRQFGILGEPRVNVLLLNMALDRLAGGPPRPAPAPLAQPGQ
ncbi:Potassium-transporting ATPase C chain [Desulfovibrio sp. X2]|uniref:potassium-transporting ATPase subunit KdpC n=1 Tax=Desulfovibrio sp. X2 TaxID=941449 RepID=UPI000358D5F2|nr:potassium-transporting ATPase subunit KdpC [Desulfovibrio sp. X2]EPR43467.1 Potassium-transporting ATPase C chain [Desulfovibrio sp. X2]